MAANDLVDLNQQLFPRLGGDAPAYENLYLGRLVASHLYEAAKFLVEAERRYGTELRPSLNRLPATERRSGAARRPGGPSPPAPRHVRHPDPHA
jgi:hypothetical protein